MSRNSSGTYTLPVADKAPLQVIPAADWNSLFNDLKTEMTDSLNRSGKGGMLAPLEFSAGTAALPSATFVLEPTSGWYRAGAGDIRMSLLTTDILKFTAGAVAVTGTLAVSGATTLTGGIATATTATGNFTMSNAAGPALFDEAATITNPTLLPNKSDTDTGIGWSSANVGILIAGGTSLASFSPTAFSMINAAGSAMMNEAATATNPTLLPNKADADSGLGWVSSNTLSFITAGIERYRLSLSGLQINVPLISTNTSDATSTSTGSIRTGGGIASTKDIFAGANIVVVGSILSGDDNIIISGGAATGLGANLTLNADTHGTPNDIRFRADTTDLLLWDESDDQWEFKKDVVFETNVSVTGDIVLTGDLVGHSATSTTHISGGTTPILGANMVLYAQTHATLADDVAFRHDAVDTLRYDSSDTQWEFKTDVVFEGDTTLTKASGAILEIHRDDSEIVVNNALGVIKFTGADPSGSPVGGRIIVQANGTWDTSDFPSLFRFQTDTAGTLVDRFEINETGVIVAGDITLVGDLFGDTAAGSTHISGGTTTSLGANMILEGQSATLADDIVFRHDTDDLLRYDSSETQWEFKKDVLFETEITVAGSAFDINATVKTSAGGLFSLHRSDATIVANDLLGGILFEGDDNLGRGASIKGVADGTWASADFPGRLEFAVTPNGGATPEIALVIKEDGQISMPLMLSGTTQPAGTAAGELWFDTDDGNTVKVGT